MEPGLNLEGFLWSFGVWIVLYLIPAVLFSSIPILLNVRLKKTKLDIWDSLFFIIPFWIWALCINLNPIQKDSGNLIEPVLLGSLMFLVFCFRVFAGEKINKRKMQLILLSVYSLIALGMFFLIEKLGEF